MLQMILQMAHFMQSITVLSGTILVLCVTDRQDNRKERLDEHTKKITNNIKKKQKENNENNKQKLKEAEIEPDTKESQQIQSSEQSNNYVDIKEDHVKNRRYDISHSLEKINFKEIKVHIQNKKNKKKALR